MRGRSLVSNEAREAREDTDVETETHETAAGAFRQRRAVVRRRASVSDPWRAPRLKANGSAGSALSR
jgi:hypothetical protein